MIDLKNVNFAYEDKPVLKNVSISIDEGEALVIMGPSGSGKSTILRLILGLETPQQGEVLIDGQNISQLNESEKREIRKKIGMVFQQGALFDSLLVGENVGYYLLEHSKLPMSEITERVIQMLGFVGLDAEEIINKLPEQLSGGMQRRVAIGRALLSTDPKIMLYDEPTTGLDPLATSNVISLINKLHDERKIASITVTHQIADALEVGDRFAVVAEGEIVLDGTLEQLRDSADPRVTEFLEPFQAAFRHVHQKKFI